MFNVYQLKTLDTVMFGLWHHPQEELSSWSKEYNAARLEMCVKPEKYVVQVTSWEESFSDKLGQQGEEGRIKIET